MKYVEINFKYCYNWDTETIMTNWYIGPSVERFLEWFKELYKINKLLSFEVKYID